MGVALVLVIDKCVGSEHNPVKMQTEQPVMSLDWHDQNVSNTEMGLGENVTGKTPTAGLGTGTGVTGSRTAQHEQTQA